MPKFIELSEVRSDGVKAPVIVNLDDISQVCQSGTRGECSGCDIYLRSLSANANDNIYSRIQVEESLDHFRGLLDIVGK